VTEQEALRLIEFDATNKASAPGARLARIRDYARAALRGYRYRRARAMSGYCSICGETGGCDCSLRAALPYWERPFGDAGDAVDFACDHCEPEEALAFLEDWRSAPHGDLAGAWPGYMRWLKVQQDGARAAARSLPQAKGDALQAKYDEDTRRTYDEG